MASKFPESGGTYTFAKKVLSVEAAFCVGWVVWFASIVAAVLYALGFAHFALVMLGDLWRAAAGDAPGWIQDPRLANSVAAGTTVVLAVLLMRSASSGGQWANIGKVAVFVILIAAGCWALARQSPATSAATLKPFFTAGFVGLIQAMGYTFIALQGFDLIAAVGGEVRDPARTLPRAMVISLVIALAIYIPLLFLVTTVGTPAGQTIGETAAENPEGIIAIAAQNYLGPFGYWLVIVAAVLSMFSALQANLFAASRIARAMARDRTLPSRLRMVNSKSGTPMVAIGVTAVIITVIIFALPDVTAAGAASSLIFLVTFALAHWIAILIRQRSSKRPPPFRAPLFPLVPVVGGLACIGLSVFQGIAVPAAGMIVLVWLSVGGVLFLALFARQARLRDASSTALEPELVTLRGHSPLVLVPIANPRNAEAMLALADALVPADVGRVLMQSVVVAPHDWQPDLDATPIEKSQAVVRELLRASTRIGIRAETLLTIAPQPMDEIARVARLHQCGSVLLGLSDLSEGGQVDRLESLLSTLDTEIVVLRARPDWRLSDAQRILVPIAGRGGHEHLLARLLGSLQRVWQRDVTFVNVLPASAKPDEVRQARRRLSQLADDEVCAGCRIDIVQSDDAQGTIAQLADQADLLILGVQRIGRRQTLFSSFTRELAGSAS